MSENFMGEVRIWANTYAPRGWAPCDGQLLLIAQNTALYSLFGTMYGGDGRTTFGVPDLQARAQVHQGQGPGLSRYQMGQKGGVDQVTLNDQQIPPHTHGPWHGTARDADTTNPTGALFATDLDEDNWNDEGNANAQLNTAAVQSVGGGAAHNNLQPFLPLNICVALQGLYPSRS